MLSWANMEGRTAADDCGGSKSGGDVRCYKTYKSNNMRKEKTSDEK